MTETDGKTSYDEPRLRARIIAGSQDLEPYKALAELLWDSPGREREAVEVLQEALSTSLSDLERAEVSAETAWFLYELGQEDRALSMAKAALAAVAAQTESPEAMMTYGISHAVLANCLYRTDRTGSIREASLALEALEALSQRYPAWENLAEARRFAGGLYFLKEDYVRAGAVYEQVIQMDPSAKSRIDALVWLGNALRCQGRLTEAEARLRAALDLITADTRYLPRLYYELGKALHLANRSAEALSAFQQTLAVSNPRSDLRTYRSMVAETWWEVGNLHYDAQRYGEAIVAFQAALPYLLEALPGLYSDTILVLGHCCLATRQHAKARDYYEEVLAAEQATAEQKATAREALSQLPPTPPLKTH